MRHLLHVHVSSSWNIRWVNRLEHSVFQLESVVKAVGLNLSVVNLLMGRKRPQVCSDLPVKLTSCIPVCLSGTSISQHTVRAKPYDC